MKQRRRRAAGPDHGAVIRNTFIAGFCILVFVLQNRLQQWQDIFQNLDELFAALVIPLFVLRLMQKRVQITWTREKLLFAAFLMVFFLSGWGGYFAYHYQPLVNAAKDAYVNLKFFMAAGASYLIFACDEHMDFEKMKRILWHVVNLITLTLFVLCVLDLRFGIFEADMRAGLRAVKLFYSAYTILVGNCVLLCAVYLWLYEQRRKWVFLPVAMLAFVMFSTRRVKAIGALACVILIFLFVFRKKKKISRKQKLAAGVIAGAAGAAGLYQTVSYYILMGVESARAVLTIGAPFIAWDHFPFGTGWGTYGSAFSVEPYSPVYGMYWMAGVWGLSPGYPEFVSDTFWPMIMGQCGYIGFAALLGALYLFGKKIWNLQEYKSAFASALVPVLYLLISSTSESAFANPVAVPLAFWLGILFAEFKANGGVHRIRSRVRYRQEILERREQKQRKADRGRRTRWEIREHRANKARGANEIDS